MPVTYEEIIAEEKHALQPRWETIVLGEGRSFDIELCPPDISRRITDYKRGHCSLERISGCVRNWRGVQNADGDELSFDRRALLEMAEANPVILGALCAAVDKLFEIPKPKAD